MGLGTLSPQVRRAPAEWSVERIERRGGRMDDNSGSGRSRLLGPRRAAVGLVGLVGAVVLLSGGLLAAQPDLGAPDRAAQSRTSVVVPPAIPLTGGYRITVRGWTRTIVHGGQRAINRCRAVLWYGPMPGGSGTTWLAGHDYCGFRRWDRGLSKGSRFKVTTPTGAVLRYRVTGHRFVGRHSGSSVGLIHGDMTLQTCRGNGTAFTYARLMR